MSTRHHTHHTDQEVAVLATPTTTVTPAEPETPFKDGAYTLTCTCGEQVTYRGFQFTSVEARRHEAWHAREGR